MSTAPIIANYLEQYVVFVNDVLKRRREGYHYICVEDFVLQNGEAFTPDKLKRPYKYGKLKECYGNAAKLALLYDNLTYVEGFGYRNILPVMHAWCVDENGLVVDPTWRWGRKGTQWESMEGELFGVRIPKDILTEKLLRTRTYGVIDDFASHWPLLQKEWI